ncbi:MAG: hypothetical protein WC788_07605 [Candidatus Paceibacterota bacterium]|jgi:hypothetical protein
MDNIQGVIEMVNLQFSERTKKILKIIEILLYTALVVAAYYTMEISEIYHVIKQLVYVMMIIIANFFSHEAGHYAAMRYYFPEANIRFVWTKLYRIPVPRAVESSGLKGHVTRAKALTVFLSGPAAGVFSTLILSYLLLDPYLFILPLATELFSSREDFEKVHKTVKETFEKGKSEQGT